MSKWLNLDSPFINHRAVANSGEIRRIASIPRRTPSADDRALYARELTRFLKTPTGAWTLHELQALALHDLGVFGGLFASIPVGGGKTLLSLLCPAVAESRRAVLLTKAALVEKTERERRELSKHWKVSRDLRVISYEKMGRVDGAKELDLWRPDLIIGDEVHALKNRKAAVTRRVSRYMQEHPETKFVAMSGTMMSHGIQDFAHILRWCLKDNAPIPKSEGELQDWADAVDDRVNGMQRLQPGALTTFSGGNADLTAVREGFQRRLSETPGVVTSSDHDALGASLMITDLRYNSGPIVEEYFKKLRTEWQTPCGQDLMEAKRVFQCARQLALGFNYAWDPAPPKDWMAARKVWARFVRDKLSASHHLDSEKQVADAVVAGELESTEYAAWQQIRPAFTPNTVILWHDAAALKACEKWMLDGPGIVWTEHSLFARELSRRSGVAYYGEQGMDKDGRYIEAADPKKSVIASVRANCTGRNLQGLYARNLITSVPGLALTMEQLIGRTHRFGQKADEVTVEILVGCWEHHDAWQKALSGADAATSLLGHTQKLLIADKSFPSESELRRLGGFRWNK